MHLSCFCSWLTRAQLLWDTVAQPAPPPSHFFPISLCDSSFPHGDDHVLYTAAVPSLYNYKLTCYYQLFMRTLTKTSIVKKVFPHLSQKHLNCPQMRSNLLLWRLTSCNEISFYVLMEKIIWKWMLLPHFYPAAVLFLWTQDYNLLLFYYTKLQFTTQIAGAHKKHWSTQAHNLKVLTSTITITYHVRFALQQCKC